MNYYSKLKYKVLHITSKNGGKFPLEKYKNKIKTINRIFISLFPVIIDFNTFDYFDTRNHQIKQFCIKTSLGKQHF